MSHEQEHLSIGEFTRWAEADREWKSETQRTLTTHGEALAALTALRDHAARAEAAAVQSRSSAQTSKNLAWLGAPIAAVISAIMAYFLGGKG